MAMALSSALFCAAGDLVGPALDEVARAVREGQVVIGDVGGVGGAGLTQLGW